MDTTQAEAVYQLVTSVFLELGASAPPQIDRSFLLHNAFYVGQVYRCEGWQAIWLIDKGRIQFSDVHGQPCRTVPLAEELVRKAA